jgi:hypothetical protein
MADLTTMNEPEVTEEEVGEEDIAIAAEFTPCTTTVGRVDTLVA